MFAISYADFELTNKINSTKEWKIGRKISMQSKWSEMNGLTHKIWEQYNFQ